MDLTEAVHTQTLIDWLINPHATTDAQGDADRAHSAWLADRAHSAWLADRAHSAWLADRAHAVSPSGPTAAQVLAGWDDLLEGCFGCPECTPDPTRDIVDGGDDAHAAQQLAGLSDQDVRLLDLFFTDDQDDDPDDDQGVEDDVDEGRDGGGVSAGGGVDRPDRVLSEEDLQALFAQGWIAPRSWWLSPQAPQRLRERGIPGRSGASGGPATAAVAAGAASEARS